MNITKVVLVKRLKKTDFLCQKAVFARERRVFVKISLFRRGKKLLIPNYLIEIGQISYRCCEKVKQSSL